MSQQRSLAASLAIALVLAASAASAQTAQQPLDAARARMDAAARAAQECTRRQCTAAELDAVVAAMNAAKRDMDALAASPNAAPPTDAQPAPSAPAAPTSPPDAAATSREPPATQVADWPAPPAFRPGAQPLPPPTPTEGKVWMKRQHLGLHWVGIGLLSGGVVGSTASWVAFANSVDRAKDFGDFAAPMIFGVVGVVATIAGIAFLASDNAMVPDASAPPKPRVSRGLTLQF